MGANRKAERFQTKGLARSWWWRTYADLVDRKQADGTITPRRKQPTTPVERVTEREMLPRPEGMSRQVQRKLYRESCKVAGVDYRGYGRPQGAPMTPEEIDEVLKQAEKEYDAETGTLKITL